MRHISAKAAANRTAAGIIVIDRRKPDKAAALVDRFPVGTEAELLDVNGVGEYKLEHYGAQFLEILRDFDAA